MLRTNLDSAFHITQEIVKKMIRARWGRVINISSVVGLMGNPGQVNYASSKAALIGFSKSLALEIGSRNVTVTAIIGASDEDLATLEPRFLSEATGGCYNSAAGLGFPARSEPIGSRGQS